jgi:hypothetical protein
VPPKRKQPLYSITSSARAIRLTEFMESRRRIGLTPP